MDAPVIAAGAITDLARVDDDQVMARLNAGSVAAFGVLYGRYCDRAHRVARSVCRDDGRAEDAVQEAFISIWRTRGGAEMQVGSVAPWVLTVVRYRAIDIARRNALNANRLADDATVDSVSAGNLVEDEVLARARARGLCSRLSVLPAAQREVLVLAFYGQLAHGEIAELLDLPLGTVKGRMRLGLRRLRLDIDDML